MEKLIQKQTEKREEKVLKIPINRIVVDEELQVRNEIYIRKVQQYATAYLNEAPLPPVIVGQRGEGFVLIDGFHRLAAMRKAGITVVEAVVTDESEDLWKWVAAKANLSHGLPLKKSELFNAFLVLVESQQHMHKKSHELKSYREITADLGGSIPHTTIRNWMLKQYPDIAKRIGDKSIPFGSKAVVTEEQNKEYMTNNTVCKAEEALENALALAKTLDDGEARGRVIGKVEEVLMLMKEQGSWVLPEVNNDF